VVAREEGRIEQPDRVTASLEKIRSAIESGEDNEAQIEATLLAGEFYRSGYDAGASEYVKHWEGRTETSERENSELKAKVKGLEWETGAQKQHVESLTERLETAKRENEELRKIAQECVDKSGKTDECCDICGWDSLGGTHEASCPIVKFEKLLREDR
jgi:DNA repair exonuclease SbcCD ATPase subunit